MILGLVLYGTDECQAEDQEPETSFRITYAELDQIAQNFFGNEQISVWYTRNGYKRKICDLSPSKPGVDLDLTFLDGDDVYFYLKGKFNTTTGPVILTGDILSSE